MRLYFDLLHLSVCLVCLFVCFKLRKMIFMPKCDWVGVICASLF